jgi:hypothetical protein
MKRKAKLTLDKPNQIFTHANVQLQDDAPYQFFSCYIFCCVHETFKAELLLSTLCCNNLHSTIISDFLFSLNKYRFSVIMQRHHEKKSQVNTGQTKPDLHACKCPASRWRQSIHTKFRYLQACFKKRLCPSSISVHLTASSLYTQRHISFLVVTFFVVYMKPSKQSFCPPRISTRLPNPRLPKTILLLSYEICSA